ncbi:MAG: hypothetical protein V5783_04580 [Pontiella sp.]
MKDLLNKIKKFREKVVTVVCRTPDGIEWTTLTTAQDKTELVHRETLSMKLPMNSTAEERARLELPDMADHIQGEITVALRSSELLMRTMKFPTADPSEISDMVSFQVDKFSPFPIDQLAIAHEIRSVSDGTAQVLMAAAKRDRIDAIGDSFKTKGFHIHSIDARILGWLQLLKDEKKLSENGCEILVLADGIDFILVVLCNGLPITFRSLEVQIDDMTVVDELTHEMSYTLTMLDAEYDLPNPESVCFWSIEEVPAQLQSKLAKKCGLQVDYRSLGELPPLSEGILRRARSEEHHIELIPREWTEHQQRLKLRKQFTFIAGSIAAIWLLVLFIALSVFKVRDLQLASAQDDANAIAPLAQKAETNQRKLEALKMYTDRTDSPIECMREITQLLPAGDIEFLSYNYNKDKGITLRGSGRNKGLVTDFFVSLNTSDLFEGIKNESVTEKTTKGARRAYFSVTLPLASQGDNP